MSASVASAKNMTTTPTSEKAPASTAPTEAVIVPAQIAVTHPTTAADGVSIDESQRKSSVTVGVNALSIWMKPTGR